MRMSIANLSALLDRVEVDFDQGDVIGAMTVLVDELRDARRSMPQEEWIKEAAPACRNHPLHTLLLQDPYTRRAFEKPRGYAGDAEMLDYVYSGNFPGEATDLGRKIFQMTTGGSNGMSVIARRDLIARKIDLAAHRDAAAILSVGSGHLREAQQASSIRSGWGGMFYALDHDEESLAVVKREQAGRGVQCICCAIGSLLRGQVRLPDLTFVYASGLYDYLSDRLAIRLTCSLFEMLGPDGQLLIGNFAPDSHGRGYMEAFMDWHLIYRDEAAMEAIADALPREQVTERSVYRDVFQNIVFLEVTRRG